MLFVVGLPAMLIELSAGQYARVGANKVFGRMVPAFKVRIKKHIYTELFYNWYTLIFGIPLALVSKLEAYKLDLLLISRSHALVN